MHRTTFRYNAETCQYERVRVTVKSVLSYGLGVGVMASCFLLAILTLHDWLVNTDRENWLRSENKALQRHQVVLADQLNELQPILASLEYRDKVLHEKFFGSPPTLPPQTIDKASKQDLLLADAASFSHHVSSLAQKSDRLRFHAAITSNRFSKGVSLEKDALPGLNVMPTGQPVQPWEPDRLISGFGMRVNPFHKGLYEHLGVDIAIPRGTPVLATASGKVTQLKRSDLQAGYGNYLEIDHGNGVVTRYAHLEDIEVRFGAKVMKGDTIGSVGSSGGSVAPHVHYEILRDGENVDPVYYMVDAMSPAEHYVLTVKSHQQNQSLD